jgi:hypothetical protein
MPKRIATAVLLAVMTLSGGTGCSSKAKEIPMDTFVKIFMSMAADEDFRRAYQRPEDAPAGELQKFTEPHGFSGEDFKLTMTQINQDEEKKKQFNDVFTKAIMEEAMKSLNADDAPEDTTAATK